ncbi:MAG: hypothetical protein JWM76_4325 [Pseudonocardiales bacterium]|nr:hypothetical protein [Pseudonocardiales bacterium]
MLSRFADMRTQAETGAAEREAFARTLLEVGPDVTTLCAGWSARDVCIHLVIFERRPDAWFGHIMGDRNERARRYYDGMVDRERARSWTSLVDRFRAGPKVGPLALDSIRNRMFLREYTIHHEDVRRANGMAARTGIDPIQEAVWSKLPGFVRLTQPADLGVKASWPGRAEQTLREGEPAVNAVNAVTLTGEPLEILLYMFGRPQVAEVEIGGAPEDVVRFGTGAMVSRPALPRMSLPVPNSRAN